MLLLAILLGMRAGDICALKFKNLDWHQKLITYTQQKTQKVNTLPLLPVIGDAIIDYLKMGGWILTVIMCLSAISILTENSSPAQLFPKTSSDI